MPQGGIKSVGSKTFEKVEVTLTPAQILQAFTTPIDLVPAPGANKILVPALIVLSMKFNTIVYATNVSVVIRVGATSVSPGVVFLGSGADNALPITPQPAGIPDVNAPIRFTVQTGNPTAGNSPVKVTVFYTVISLT